MSYKFLSVNASDAQHENQWDGRTLEVELTSFTDRSLSSAFEKFLGNRKLRIIEAGCGLGAWCEWFVRRRQDVIGIEFVDDVVKQTKKHTPSIPVELGDITSINYADSTFDIYVSLGVIEHFEAGPEKALVEAARVLKPEGLAFFTVPVLTPVRRYIAHPIRDLFFLIKKLKNQPTYFWEYRYTREELKRYIENAGFLVLEEGVDDFNPNVNDRHMGLWADWFFLRQKSGDMWALNGIGKLCLRLLKLLPSQWYCSGWLVVARVCK